MKNIVLYVSLFVSFFAFAQETSAVKVIYKYNYLRDSTDIYSQKSDTMALETSLDHSVFYSHLRKVGDSLFNKDQENGVDRMTMVMNRYKYHFDKSAYQITKNFIKNELTFYDKILTDAIEYKENIPKINWSIEDDKDSLLGLSVRKAKGHFAGRDYIVWFTEDISIPDGPYKFTGLPGLILKVEDTKKQFLFEAVALKRLDSIQGLEQSTKPIVTSKKQYFELKERASKDLVKYVNTSTEVKITPTDNRKTKPKPYNPIELE